MFPPIRLILILLLAAFLPQLARAQYDADETPLGDVARNFRKKVAPTELTVDNDNIAKVVEDAESRRAAGSTLVFSLDPGGRNIRVSAPDVSCSLSFSAKTSALLADPMMLDELPREELAKLDGPGAIDGDSLQLSIHNGTAWELHEIVVGLTIVRSQDTGNSPPNVSVARIVPAVAGGPARPVQDSFQKQPDSTVLLRMKGSAGPSATATFRTQLNFALFPDQEWHWAIIRAKGVPPQNPSERVATAQTNPVMGPPLPPASENNIQSSPQPMVVSSAPNAPAH
jgi:hypothetical protein